MHQGKKPVHWLVITVLAVALVVSWVRPLAGQNQKRPASTSTPGRYQMSTAVADGAIYLALTDTTTGQTWTMVRGANEKWKSVALPQRKE